MINHSEDNYLASVSDLMVGLLFIFAIILMAFALNYRLATDENKQQAIKQQQQHALLVTETHAQQQEKQRLIAEKKHLETVVERLTNNETVRRVLLQEIQVLLKKRGLNVLIDETQGVLRLPESLLFDSGKADFRPEGKQAIERLAMVLLEILPCYSLFPDENKTCSTGQEARLEAVLIEGHTDNKPIRNAEFKDNWALASARALTTYKTLINYAPQLDLLKNTQKQALLSVSAYEARRPVENATSAKNRRIDLRFLMASPPPALIESAKSKIQQP